MPTEEVIENVDNTGTEGTEQQNKPNVVIKNNGGSMTAEVEPQGDPMASIMDDEGDNPTESEGGAGDSQDEDKEGEKNNLETKVSEQLQTEKDVKEDLANKGVDFDKLANEYDKNGALSQESLDALNKAGYPKSVVDAYLNGLQATADQFTNEVKSYAGGAEGYAKLTAFIQTQPQSTVDAFNATIMSGNLGQIKLAINGLQAQMNKAYGTSNRTIMGGANRTSNSVSGYTSMEQMTKDMSDPRYQNDPEFTKMVYQKVKNASIF